jgi:anthranilate phosphoribosyltransferase
MLLPRPERHRQKLERQSEMDGCNRGLWEPPTVDSESHVAVVVLTAGDGSHELFRGNL